MKVLLVAVNAKYIHSNLAVYCLKSYAASKGLQVEIAEYTINQQQGEVLRDLYERKADVVGFSCYIWNIDFIKAVIRDYKKVCPASEIWLGGPEVSYRGEEVLRELPEVRGIMVGEGEETFSRVISKYADREKSITGELLKKVNAEAKGVPEKGNGEVKVFLRNRTDITADFRQDIPGIVVRQDNGDILTTEKAVPPDFSRLPFPYGNGSLDSFENRIIYYESSRGCPFSCAYCLSSIDRRVRFRDMELVKQELKFFMEKKVPQVKFIDRTFNANAARTMELLTFIKENDNGITNFHFEIAAELLTAEQIKLLATLRPGLVQLEIGVQSTNMETLAAVHRKTEFRVLREKVAAVRKQDNVHIHLDLIAGLSKEDMASFIHSFNDVYRMKPHQLQLGFLKVLSGSPMERMAEEDGIIYQSTAPYEVLSTKWLSFDDIIRLKKVEEMVEVYYNSGQFIYSILYLQHFFKEPFELFDELATFYERNQLSGVKLSRNKRYEILLEFAENILQKRSGQTGQSNGSEENFSEENFSEQNFSEQNFSEQETTRKLTEEYLRITEEVLFYDYCLREKPKSRPAFCRQSQMDKQELKEVYLSFGIRREEEGMHDVEKFSFDPEKTAEQGKKVGESCVILFSYEKREAMYGQATTRQITD